MDFIVEKVIKQEMTMQDQSRFKRIEAELIALKDKLKKLEDEQVLHERDPMGHEF